MKLHEDGRAFAALIENIRGKSGIRQDVLEKDYYVTLLGKPCRTYMCTTRRIGWTITIW